MPFLDAQNLFSDAQQITAATGTYDSQNTIDFGAGAGRNLNPRARVFCQIINTPVGTGSTLKAVLVGCNTLAGTYTEIASSAEFTIADMQAGTLILEGFPELLKSNYRYVKMQYVVGGAAFTTAPKVTAGIVQDGMFHHELEH